MVKGKGKEGNDKGERQSLQQRKSGYPSLFFEERPVSFVRGLLISFNLSPWCDLSSQGLLGRVLSAQELLSTMLESLAVPLIPLHLLRGSHSLIPLHCIHRQLGANSSVFTMWSGGASLHPVEEHLSGL